MFPADPFSPGLALDAATLDTYVARLMLPEANSHKGQNGKLLIIGGSNLFHAASKWSLDIASKFVDMVFYSSIPSNNELIQAAKGEFWNGIVVARDQLENYLLEADCVLIGPGMERNPETAEITNHLVAKYRDKKWVIDAGALQMIEPSLLGAGHIITPHARELAMLLDHMAPEVAEAPATSETKLEQLLKQKVTVLLKGQSDRIYTPETSLVITGGNAGMTKGGTGDVLAGLVAALYCTQESETAVVLASYSNKKAGDELYTTVGPYFNASDLVDMVPKVLWKLKQDSSKGTI